jgi:hypothetical protein
LITAGADDGSFLSSEMMRHSFVIIASFDTKKKDKLKFNSIFLFTKRLDVFPLSHYILTVL